MKFLKKIVKPFLSFLLAIALSKKANAFVNHFNYEKNLDSIINRNIERKKFSNSLQQKAIKNQFFRTKNSIFLNMNIDNPSWLTGFTDGEGCFSVSFNRREKLTTGIEARPSFAIRQKANSLEALKNIRDFFGCGSIRYSAIDGCYKYEIRNLNDLVKKVIPHFEKYPLKTQKKNDFDIFANICKDMKQNKHLNSDGIKKLIKDGYTMNPAGKRKYSYEEIIKHVKD